MSLRRFFVSIFLFYAGFNMPIGEALLMGKPVVLYNISVVSFHLWKDG